MKRFLILFALTASAAAWASVRSGERVVLGRDDSVNEDLYLAGGEVIVLGNIDGDLVVAGGQVQVEGRVTGDVLAVGGQLTLNGPVGGSIRAAGGDVTVKSTVAHDAMLVGGQLSVPPGAVVGRDLMVAGGRVDASAAVGRDVHGRAGELTVGGPVSGDVFAQSETLRLAPSARIGGRLVYASMNELVRDPGASVAGAIEHQEARLNPAMRRLPLAVRWGRSFVGLLALGLLWRFLTPRWTERTEAALVADPWRSLATGLGALFGGILATMALFVIGGILGGWWLGLFLLAILALGAALSFPLLGTWLGRQVLAWFGKRDGRGWWALVLGLLLLTLAVRIPVVGGFVMLAVLLFGLGAEVVTLLGERRHLRDQRPLVPAAVGRVG